MPDFTKRGRCAQPHPAKPYTASCDGSRERVLSVARPRRHPAAPPAPQQKIQAISIEERISSMLCSIFAQVSINGLTARCMTSPLAIALVKKLIVARAATAPSLRIGLAMVVVQ